LVPATCKLNINEDPAFSGKFDVADVITGLSTVTVNSLLYEADVPHTVVHLALYVVFEVILVASRIPEVELELVPEAFVHSQLITPSQPGVACKVTFPPEQIAIGVVLVIVGVLGSGFSDTIISLLFTLKQLLPSLHLAEYVPALETVIEIVVALLDHSIFPVQPEADKTTLLPEQKVDGPPAEIVGGLIAEFNVTTASTLLALKQPFA
jgi:hypothetical protein